MGEWIRRQDDTPYTQPKPSKGERFQLYYNMSEQVFQKKEKRREEKRKKSKERRKKREWKNYLLQQIRVQLNSSILLQPKKESEEIDFRKRKEKKRKEKKKDLFRGPFIIVTKHTTFVNCKFKKYSMINIFFPWNDA